MRPSSRGGVPVFSRPSANPWRARAFEELAKHYEHRERDYATALEMTRQALRLSDMPRIRRREQRLRARLAKLGVGQLEKLGNG